MDLTPEFYRNCIERIDYSGLDEPFRNPMQNCIERGCSPGDALLCVLENNLKAVMRFEDPWMLYRVFRWVNNALPLPIWGSRKKVRAWMDMAHSQWRVRA